MILILAEKPSVAKTISSFLKANTRKDGYFEGNGYVVTYAVGHLISLFDMKDYDKEKYSGSWKMENYPFIPEDKFRFKVDKDKRKQFKIVESLINREDIEYIINATDNDREGELISFLIFMMAGNKKPIKRILVNEWTPEDITRGLNELKDDEEMRNLQAAGYTRLITDWLIGINFTCAATLKYGNGKLLNIGRVILPTVKLVYDRDMEIKNFVPKLYYEIEGKFKSINGEYTGKYQKGKKSKFDTVDEAKLIVDNIKSNIGVINEKKITKSKEYAPKLFSLTSLQGYITSKYSSFTSDKVLNICQNLYEGKGKGGYITYPRTDSMYLEESLIDKTKKTLEILRDKHDLKDCIKFSKTKRVFDSSKVESHSAIIPTYIIPNNLSEDEKLVYEAIRDRFLANFMPPAEYENTEIKTIVGENLFISKGKVLVNKGFLEIFGKENKGNLLPIVEKGEEVEVLEIKPVEKNTTPPKPYTEDTLLKAMKNCGKNVPDDDTTVLSGYSIGTSATRADVLKKINQVGYVKKKSKKYYITDLGINLVEIFPVKSLFDVDFTGKLEKNLFDIQKGNHNRKEYLNNICKFVYDNVNLIKKGPKLSINKDKIVYNPDSKKYVKESSLKIKNNLEVDKKLKNNKESDNLKKNNNSKNNISKSINIDKETGLEIICGCPECENSILESQKAFACKNYRNCGFIIWKNDPVLKKYKKKPNKTMVRALAKNKKAKVRGLISNNGQKFESNITYFYDNNKKLIIEVEKMDKQNKE
ncbi:type IA DNA topoisomerase [Peptostreptococcus canis]|uniref:DNA topoisomerase n=1 Tax=Peptostreptococcus canis TaxID=1159213 RepID=A0ABR6TKN0_9FIRM|nr:DNA topoisomerase [Peptostreptococcus canis]MBC2575798.1 type IA DNA topoisomerase [Peptostreptococcus canis]MBP1998087.1 DNA topoisomerase-3 [Peptostreptococcus canis]